jgi:hypothetical protein
MRWGRGVIVAVVMVLCAPGAAHAAWTANFVAKPISASDTCSTSPSLAVDAPAGAHRDFCLAFDFANGEDAKDMDLMLPPGVVGDPTAAPACPQATFRASNCPANTQVGDVSAKATLGILSPTLAGQVYNLQPNPDEPARLGIYIDPAGALGLGVGVVRIESSVRVRLTDYGLTSQVRNIDNTFHVNNMALTMWGSKTDHPTLAKPFITLPTRCDVPAVASARVTTYEGTTVTPSSSFDVKECDQVPFDVGLAVGPKTPKADEPGAASATLIYTKGDVNGRHQSYLRRVDLQLPPGLALNPPLGNGLQPCTEEQFGQFEDRTPACPASSEIGSVAFKTPIFDQPLTGKVYFGTPTPGHLLRNFVSVEDPRLRVKLIGDVTVDPVTGAVLNVFDNQPQVPFETFKFEYNGGDRAVLTSPTTCDTFNVTATMTPWSVASNLKSPIDTFTTIDCPPPAFTPTLSDKVDNAQAGGDAALNVRIERPDRQLRMQKLSVSLPPGLTGRLPAVPACKVADARANACPESSRVGSVSVSVGTGNAPLTLPGTVYLTDGFDGGIAGLAIIVPAKVPALDLGTVVTMAKLVVRPDTGIDVVTEDLPQSIQGIPTVYRAIDMTIDRKGFMRNATNCGGLSLKATFTAVGGTTAQGEAPYQATGCDKLPFAPKLTTAVGAPGEVGKGGHPPLSVVIEQADGESAMRRAVVRLPKGLAVDIAHIGVTCTDAQLATSSCPQASRMGDVSADTPLLPNKLTGGAYLMQSERKGGLPGIALDLGLTRLRGAVTLAADGQLTTTFETIPDVPLRKLTLVLAGGKSGVLSTGVDLCGAKPVVDGQFSSQSGKDVAVQSPSTVVGCKAALKVTGTLRGLKKRRPSLRLKVTSTDGLRELRLKLPAGLSVRSSKAIKKSAQLLFGSSRMQGSKVTYKNGRVVFRAPNAGTRSFGLTLPSSVLKLKGKALKAGRKATFTVTGIDGTGKAVTAKVRLTARR